MKLCEKEREQFLADREGEIEQTKIDSKQKEHELRKDFWCCNFLWCCKF